jgi:threonine/homoserine/homoserine lactone efflux protein
MRAVARQLKPPTGSALAWAVMITALAPGLLLALLLAQTLRHGPREGCKIALSPLATDAPIIVVALVLSASRIHTMPRRCRARTVSLVGGAPAGTLGAPNWFGFRA